MVRSLTCLLLLSSSETAYRAHLSRKFEILVDSRVWLGYPRHSLRPVFRENVVLLLHLRVARVPALGDGSRACTIEYSGSCGWCLPELPQRNDKVARLRAVRHPPPRPD